MAFLAQEDGGALVGGAAPPTTPPLHILRGQSPLKLPNFLLDFGIPKLRTFFEDFDPMWPLQRSYCLENVRILSLSILGFHQNLSKILIFISQSPPFYENPISSVRPSETQKGRFLCVHPHSGGVVRFSIIGFSSMTPPWVTDPKCRLHLRGDDLDPPITEGGARSICSE